MEIKFDPYCMNCKHYRRAGADTLKMCHYIFDKDMMRPCPPGKDCTVKELKRRKKNGK